MKIAELERFCVVPIAGEDACAFLQRQFTNDMQDVTDNKASFGAYLSPKGRILANFMIVLDDENEYRVVLSRDLCDEFVKRLKIFVFRDRVEIESSSDIKVYGIQGADNDIHLPDNVMETGLYGQSKVIRLPGQIDRFFALSCENIATPDKDKFRSSDWFLQDVYAAIPWISQANQEQYVPQAVNLDLIGAVSFVKGCYPGQEIVARLHYKGGVNHRMVRAACEPGPVVKVGDKVECPDIPGNQTGTVVESQPGNGKGVQQLLVSLPLRFLRANELKLEDARVLSLCIDELPYTIPQVS